MGLYDEIAIFWGIIVFVICISTYMVGYLCYRLGFRDGEANAIKRISRHAEREVQRRVRRLR